MRLKEWKRAVLIVACITAVGFGASWKWTGSGNDDDWDTGDNWDLVSGFSLFNWPHTTLDDAKIPSTQGGYDIDLTTETIDDLLIDGDVDFGSAGGTPTLTLDTFQITGDATVTITGATIRVWN